MSAHSANRSGERAYSAAFSREQFEQLVEVISRSQQSYRELIDNLDQAVFTLSVDGEVRVANRCLLEILGVTFQELIGHRLSEFVESPTLEKVWPSLPALAKDGMWTGVVPVRLKKDGALRQFNCWLHAIVEGEQVSAVFGWARDITVQLESDVRFADLFESLREGIFFSTPEGRILDANPAFVRMLGYDSKEELLACDVRDLHDTPLQRDALVRETIAKGAVRDVEVVYRRKDGRRIQCLASASAVRDSAGRLRFQGMIEDVSELREAQKKLRAEEKFLRPLMESLPNIVSAVDRQGRFSFVSERVRAVLDLAPQDLVGKYIGKRTHPDDQLQLASVLQHVLGGHQRYAEFEHRLLHADGSWHTVLTSFGPLFDNEGNIAGAVVTTRDVTDSKQMEQQLARAEKFAAMGQMLAGAAHELNNPLTAILGIADLLRERAGDDAMRRHADIVLQQARRAAGIVRDLLALSRPPLEKRTPLHLTDIVQQVVQLEREALDQKNIRVNFSAPRELPPVEGDSKLLTQVFQNLVANAEQSISGAGRDHGRLDISLVCQDGSLCVTFADDGPGIPPENLGKLFDPFFTTKRPGGGSGLGLTICTVIVKDHGGKIQVEPTQGGGATFRVFLPVAAHVSEEPDQMAAAARLAEHSTEALPRPAVLVVDDEESILEIVREGLTARGMRVATAASAEAALSHLAKDVFDVVVCDFNLPGMNGEQLFDKAHAQLGDMLPRFVIMTGDLVETEVSERMRENGASVMQKPFHVSELAALVAGPGRPVPARTQ
jgi:PAS domain S-box-containing protein